MNTKIFASLSVGFALLGFGAGCGDSTKARVSGKVTIGGKPFYGTVVAENAEGKKASAMITKGGQYVIPDAPVGKVTFYVQPQAFPGMSADDVANLLKGSPTSMEIMAGKGNPDKKPNSQDVLFGFYQSKLPSWMTKDDVPQIIEGLKVDPKHLTKSSGLEKELKGGSNTTYDIVLQVAPPPQNQ